MFDQQSFYFGMAQSNVICILLALAVLGVCQQSRRCCDSYDKSQLLCLTCPDGSYYYGNNCIMDLDGCAQYSDCFACSQCADGFKQVEKLFNGIKVNRCEKSVVEGTIGSRPSNDNSVTYAPINTSSKQDPLYDSYLVADDYMKSFHKEIKNASTLSAYKKKTDGTTDIIEIDYEAPGDGASRYFRTAMTIDLQKYDFKEVSFVEVTSKDVRKGQVDSTIKTNTIKAKDPIDISACIGGDTKNGDSTEKLLDLREPANLKLVQIVDQIARGSSSAFKKIVSVKIISSKGKTDFIELTYQTNEDYNHAFSIDPITRKVVSINGGVVTKPSVVADLTVNKPPTSVETPKDSNPQPTPPALATAPTVSTQQSMPDAKKSESTVLPQVIPVSIQNRNQHSSKPPIIPAFPKSSDSFTQSNQLSTGSSGQSDTQVGASSNLPPLKNVPAPTVVKTPQVPKQSNNNNADNQRVPQVASSVSNAVVVSLTSKPSQPSPDASNIWPKSEPTGLSQQNNVDLLKDLRFLMVKDMINKNLQGYQDLLPASCYSKTDATTKSFLMTFTKAEGFQTQIMASVVLATFAPSITYEHQISKVPEVLPASSDGARSYKPKDISELTKISYYISAAVAIEKVNKDYCADNLIAGAINQNDPNIIYFRTTYNVAGRTWEVESFTKKKLRIGQFISQKDVTPPNKVVIKLPEAPPAPAPSPTPAPVPSQPVKPNVPLPSDKKDNPKPDPTPPVLVNCEVSKAVPKSQDLLSFSTKNQELSQNILTEIGGFVQVPATAARADVNFLKVEAYSECTSMKTLRDGQIVAVFSKVVGFSVQYKIFYETSKRSLFQMYAALDRLKNKIYIINFNQLTFGVVS